VQGRQLRVRHDDPRLSPYSPYSPKGAMTRSAVDLASDVEDHANGDGMR